MATFRGIPDKYLAAVCLALAFLFSRAGGTAFNQTPFLGEFFFVLAMVLFLVGVHFGRKEPDTE